jgi:hypothetical protein
MAKNYVSGSKIVATAQVLLRFGALVGTTGVGNDSLVILIMSFSAACQANKINTNSSGKDRKSLPA